MERFLEAYIERIRPSFPGYPGETAHGIASSFLAFRYGLYANAVRECTKALSLVPPGSANDAVRKALEIIRANARDRDNSQVTPDMDIAFTEAEKEYTAVSLPADHTEDPGSLSLDNALILVYVVALLTSPDDEETLGEHRKMIVRLLTDYKKALGLE